jgi:hypothetical protein
MSHRKTLSGLFVAPLVVAAIAAPAVQAVPIDPRQLDMYASTVQKPAAPKQDLRSEATVDATPVNPQTHAPAAQQDLRTEAATAGSPTPEIPAGMPVWPRNPEPVVRVSHDPVTTGGDDGIEWPLSGILLAGALLLGGTLGVAGTRYRVRQSHA